MPTQVELVVSGIQYPADMVAIDEQTLYLVNIQSQPGGPHAGVHSSGQVLKIHMPNAPESMDGAYTEVVMSGLANPAYIARASGSGRTVVQCYGWTGYADGSSGSYGYPVAQAQALLEVPSGGVAWDCAAPGEAGTFGRTRPETIVGPRGIALSPDGGSLYVFESEGAFVNDFIIANLRVVTSGTPENMWSSGLNNFACWTATNDIPQYLKIEPSGEFLWIPGAASMPGLARMHVSTRGMSQFGGCSSAVDGSYMLYGQRFTGIGFQDPFPNLMNPDPVHSFVTAPGFLAGLGRVWRFTVPAADGTGFVRYPYRSSGSSTTGESRFYNLQGVAVTPGGQVFVSCGNWGTGGMRYGNHLGLGTAFDSGCVFRVNKLTPLPADYEDTTQPTVQPTEMDVIKNWRVPRLMDDHSSTEIGVG